MYSGAVTDNEAAIVRNERAERELEIGGKIANAALLGVCLSLAIALVVVISTFSAANRQLRTDRDAQDSELRCRSSIVNEQAEAQARLTIADAHNDSITSRALAQVARGEAFDELIEPLELSADALDELSALLEQRTRARTLSVDTCRAG